MRFCVGTILVLRKCNMDILLWTVWQRSRTAHSTHNYKSGWSLCEPIHENDLPPCTTVSSSANSCCSSSNPISIFLSFTFFINVLTMYIILQQGGHSQRTTAEQGSWPSVEESNPRPSHPNATKLSDWPLSASPVVVSVEKVLSLFSHVRFQTASRSHRNHFHRLMHSFIFDVSSN